MNKPFAQTAAAPGLAYFHIPLPEYASFDSTNFTGVKMEAGISSPLVNSGFFTTMVEAGDVKAVFTGHDHLNDFCGELTGINLCYAGGFGYHAYGKAGWSRRARVVVANLERTANENWETVKSIKTWKRLDDQRLTAIDGQVLWSKSSAAAGMFLYLFMLLILFQSEEFLIFCLPANNFLCYLSSLFFKNVSKILMNFLFLTISLEFVLEYVP